ncbi:MAG: DUF982 domain-containing protein [Mesorhizobium sp.]|uniref:DUF982 domain-containing protein n=1 Tax=Mesorhizobium sp. TaxID=1871066 RepID=UPI000FE98A15|nr:DUF982 domain-containing protein [Mesorhizobium sp.]RWL83211.1 MAG: DUF982 domain-containing protein [Mesorhizobium sp.]RWL90363.1 MAG: DUF982 domain-containing protein [Mesorhizobium sp.]RWL99950.1 MAG: DUF982 domain-containing protein [Mesorhizobium sp.]TIP02631.1 MAG: DUF982 domain-containing protein [Mesorhizobium sp.]
MGGKKFRFPLVVYIAGPVGFTLIESVAQASDFLFDHWPGNDSLAWTDAMKRCAEDYASDDASAAFLIALEGAGISYDRTVEIY